MQASTPFESFETQIGRVAGVEAAFPSKGFFKDKEWLLSPDAFVIAKQEREQAIG